MSTLLDQAKKISQAQQDQAQLERDTERVNREHLEARVTVLRRALMKEIRLLDGQANKRGKFYLERKKNGPVDCFLWGNRTTDGQGYLPVLWVKSEVASGTYDASDDCRDIPYTAACLTLRIYRPSGPTNRQWDTEQREFYHNGGWTESITDMKDMPRMLKFLAEWLAQWV